MEGVKIIMKKIFVNAYVWVYGTTKKEAMKAYKTTDANYHNAIIKCFLDNAKASFYRD